MQTRPEHLRRVQKAAAVDSFGTGMVAGGLAVVVATQEGLGALGLVFSVRLVAAVMFTIWARRVSAQTGSLHQASHAPAVVAMVAASISAVVVASFDVPVWVRMLAYLMVATTNSAAGLHISARAPMETFRLGAWNAAALAVSSSLAGGIYAWKGAEAFLVAGIVVALVQLVEIPLLRDVPTAERGGDIVGSSTLRWGVLAFLVSCLSYGPLALASGIVAREYGAQWVAPALLTYAAASLATPRLGKRYAALPTWVMGISMCAANLVNLLIPLGVLAYIAGRMVVSGLMYTIDGTLRLKAFKQGGTRALVAVGNGSTVGVAIAIVSFGYGADHIGVAGAGVVYAAGSLVFAGVLRALGADRFDGQS